MPKSEHARNLRIPSPRKPKVGFSSSREEGTYVLEVPEMRAHYIARILKNSLRLLARILAVTCKSMTQTRKYTYDIYQLSLFQALTCNRGSFLNRRLGPSRSIAPDRPQHQCAKLAHQGHFERAQTRFDGEPLIFEMTSVEPDQAPVASA